MRETRKMTTVEVLLEQDVRKYKHEIDKLTHEVILLGKKHNRKIHIDIKQAYKNHTKVLTETYLNSLETLCEYICSDKDIIYGDGKRKYG